MESTNKIRVLHILGSMGQGGAENFLMNLYRNIDKEKIQFDFLVNRPGYFDDEIKSLGGKIYIIDALQKVGQFKYTKNLDEFFSKNKYKIVHSHLNQVTGLILERAKKANIPIRIAHSHNSKSNKNIIIKLYKSYLQNKIFKNATKLLACSDLAAKWLYKDNSKDAIIINNCIDTNKFKFNNEYRSEIRKKYGIKENTLVLGHVGRFNEQKNHIYLLEIFHEVYKNNKNIKLILCGDGILKEKIVQKAKDLNIYEDIIFVGNTKDVYKYYSAMDICIFPSLYEGLPLSLVEAQCSGLKCIISDTISDDIMLTDNIFKKSININANEWIGSLEINKKNREIYFNKIKELNYDYSSIVLKMEKIYINSIIEENNK